MCVKPKADWQSLALRVPVSARQTTSESRRQTLWTSTKARSGPQAEGAGAQFPGSMQSYPGRAGGREGGGKQRNSGCVVQIQ